MCILSLVDSKFCYDNYRLIKLLPCVCVKTPLISYCDFWSCFYDLTLYVKASPILPLCKLEADPNHMYLTAMDVLLSHLNQGGFQPTIDLSTLQRVGFLSLGYELT